MGPWFECDEDRACERMPPGFPASTLVTSGGILNAKMASVRVKAGLPMGVIEDPFPNFHLSESGVAVQVKSMRRFEER